LQQARAAYAFREDSTQIILDISISNSKRQCQSAIQPFLSIVNNFGWNRIN